MGIFSEDYDPILKNGTWTRHGKCPTILEPWESKGEAPDEGIQFIDDDVDTETGSASNGKIIYENQSGTILAWSNNKTDRYNILWDLIDIINASGDSALITGYLATTFLDKKGFELRVRRIP